MVGGMVLARGVADPALSDRILGACRTAAGEVSRKEPAAKKAKKPKKEEPK